jgi:hypothetical protein
MGRRVHVVDLIFTVRVMVNLLASNPGIGIICGVVYVTDIWMALLPSGDDAPVSVVGVNETGLLPPHVLTPCMLLSDPSSFLRIVQIPSVSLELPVDA